MKIKRIIVHEVQKQAKKKETKLITSDQLIPISDQSIKLVESLSKSYNSDKILYGIFNLSDSSYFPKSYNEYKDLGAPTNQDFVDLTKDQISSIIPFISTKNFAKGGYFLFTEYENNGFEFYGIFLLRDTAANTLKRTGNTYTIDSVEYLDTNHLAMAFRLNKMNYSSQEGNYISFTNRKQPDVSEYFTDWICATKLESSSEYTEKLYSIINNIPLPLDPKTKKKYSIDEVRNMVYDHARSNSQRNINIRRLSEHVYGDEEVIQTYINENNIEIDSEFRFDRSALRKFVQLAIDTDGIKLKFSRGDFGSKIRIAEGDSNMVIIESEVFARKLKYELDQDV